MIPLQRKAVAPSSLGGGPEDVGAFLYWLMQQPPKRDRTTKLVLPKKKRRLLKVLQALDAARTLQLARQLGQFFMSDQTHANDRNRNKTRSDSDSSCSAYHRPLSQIRDWSNERNSPRPYE